MVNAPGPRLVIAGTSSGVGKTSLTLGLARSLARNGLRVQTFKVGPDFLDPTWLAAASGRTCYNLDGWMTSREYCRGLFARATADADLAIVEGVMGMFDGASPCSLEGSTAEVALWLDAPVLLVVNAHGVARSIAATVQGFAQFEQGVNVAGVIANHCGSSSHRQWLAAALDGAKLPPLVGAMPRGAIVAIPDRHLGLVSADASNCNPQTLDQLANAVGEHLDLNRIMELARSSAVGWVERREPHQEDPNPDEGDSPIFAGRKLGQSPLRLGIARDEAFHFYYADNLEALEQAGAELVPFSPLADRALPPDLDGLYFGGGYPELHAARLAGNATMLDAVRGFAASGRCVYAECGGLMYLGQSLRGLDGQRHAMAGVLPIETAMLAKLRTLGYAEVTLGTDSLWGQAGQTRRGHEFHYSEITADRTAAEGWRPAYRVARRRAAESQSEGFAKGNVLASYVHLHWASCPEADRHFVTCCEKRS
jgi:cobyrinic acid a,c-diamide synthase